MTVERRQDEREWTLDAAYDGHSGLWFWRILAPEPPASSEDEPDLTLVAKSRLGAAESRADRYEAALREIAEAVTGNDHGAVLARQLARAALAATRQALESDDG